jgi:ribosomal protein L15E
LPAKDRHDNQRCWEMWAEVSRRVGEVAKRGSVDNRIHVERGPQGAGGLVKGQGLVRRVENMPVAKARPKAGVNERAG